MQGTVRMWKTTISSLGIILLLGAVSAHAASVASKNKSGNRLFEQGKYQDAEKAYLDAQGDAPGRPELVYNFGNSLLKQKKYDQALQSLRQAIGKADKGLQAKAWFNSGNALYEMANYGDAAQAYIQSLRINPGDRDAKYNLELALKKVQEQQKQQSGGKKDNDKDQNKQESKQEQQNSGDPSEKQKKEKQPSAGNEQKQQDQSQKQPSQPANRSDNSISKDRALQILDALRDQELADQRKLMERQVRHKATGKDW
jgi:Ca-activated chloride channel family protein